MNISLSFTGMKRYTPTETESSSDAGRTAEMEAGWDSREGSIKSRSVSRDSISYNASPVTTDT
jgi:hypothetical protein